MISDEVLAILKRMHIKQLIEHKKTTGHIMKMLSDKLQKANIQTKLPDLEDLRKYIKDTYSFIEIEVPGGLVGELKWAQASESSEETNGGINTHEQVKPEESNDKKANDTRNTEETVESIENEEECTSKIDNEQPKTDSKININANSEKKQNNTDISQDQGIEETRAGTDEKSNEDKLSKPESTIEIKTVDEVSDETNVHELVQSEESNSKHSINDESIGDTIKLPKHKKGRKLKVDDDQDQNNLPVNDNSTGDSLSKSALEGRNGEVAKGDMDNKADEAKPFKLESITEMAQAIESLNKNIKELKAEIRTVKTMLGNTNSAKKTSVNENRQSIEQIMKIYTSASAKREIHVNKEIEKCIKDLIYELYGIKDEDNKVINTALLLALLKGRM